MRVLENAQNIAKEKFELDLNSSSQELDSTAQDWLADFFDKAANISDEDVAMLWGKLLATELFESKCYNRIIINKLALLDKYSAMLFSFLVSSRTRVELKYNNQVDVFFTPFILQSRNYDPSPLFYGTEDTSTLIEAHDKCRNDHFLKLYCEAQPEYEDMLLLEYAGLIEIKMIPYPYSLHMDDIVFCTRDFGDIRFSKDCKNMISLDLLDLDFRFTNIGLFLAEQLGLDQKQVLSSDLTLMGHFIELITA